MNAQFLRYAIPAALGAGAGLTKGYQEGGVGGALGGAALGAGLGAAGMGLARASFSQSGPLAGKFVGLIDDAGSMVGKGARKASEALNKAGAGNAASLADDLANLVTPQDGPRTAGEALQRQRQITNVGSTALGSLGALGGAGLTKGIIGAMNPAIDPEIPGSSNTQGARMSMQAYPGMYA
tara:strand:+ start:848 stop:1390 length:543 start_codon:yes stop_codon:yes gene_type:complete